MPPLRAHRRLRRDRRASAPRRRPRRNLVKFIPEADTDFAFTANSFVSYLKRDPEAYGLSIEDVQTIESQVKNFRNALAQVGQARVGGSHSPQLIRRKDGMRRMAESTVRMFADIIRANPRVDPTKKSLLRIKVRTSKPKKRKCPQAPPTLYFLGSGDGAVGGMPEGSGSGVHVLRFCDESNGGLTIGTGTMLMSRRAKPDGATRIDLYFDMIPPGESVPKLPNERGWPKFLRSYTKSPIEVQFPIPMNGPMLLVYWARWADSSGEVSRWSKPCVARVEGWTSHVLINGAPAHALPAAEGVNGGVKAIGAHRVETKYIFVQTPIAGELPDGLPGDAEADALSNGLLEAGMLEATRLLEAGL